METVVLFPGLGASEKLFDHFNFVNRKKYVANFLVPVKNESLHHYAERLAENIPRDNDLIFVGVSFGGILAQEVSKIIPPKKIIIISSIKSEKEKPGYFSLLKIFPLYKIIPTSLLKKMVVTLGEIFTPKTKEESVFFLSLVKEAKTSVIRWGIYQTIHWRQAKTLPGIVHIHGSKDRLFPVKKLNVDFLVQGGSHFMIIQRAKEINRLIEKILDT